MNSVKTYIRSAYRKIGVTTRAQVVSWCPQASRPTTDGAPVRLGIVTLPVTLLDLPTEEVGGRGGEVRDAASGRRVTFSPKVFIPLTRLSGTGAATARSRRPRTTSPRRTCPRRRSGHRLGRGRGGCHEALFTLGEAPEDRYAEARDWLTAHGYASTVDYLVAMCARVLEETGLLPHANAGAVPGRPRQLRRWRRPRG